LESDTPPLEFDEEIWSVAPVSLRILLNCGIKFVLKMFREHSGVYLAGLFILPRVTPRWVQN
jgi:hypothetical protein